MFKKQNRQRPLYVGDHVIALPELGELEAIVSFVCKQ